MKWDIENQKLVASFLNRLSGVYDKATKQAVGLGYSVTNYNSDKPFSFSDFPVTGKKADNLFSQMAYEVQSLINGGTSEAWLMSNTANDGLVDKYFAKSGLSKEQLSKYYDRNLNALSAYQNRIDSGVQLSDRVWKYTKQFKNEIELAVSVGIGEGRSADQLSRDIRGYLQNPDKLFHKVKNQYGQLVLSKNAKAYHPGQGVYRSSYKNAVRLARTEINMAFHQADNERWNSLDFISGYKVVMSNQHPEYDICDELHGDYPKTFTFWGWHVQCMCHTEPIMSSDKEFASQTAKLLKGEDISGYIPSNSVNEMPGNFKQWAIDNQERIQTAKSMPYFIDKNFKGTNVAEWFKKAEKTPQIVEKAPVLTAKELEKLEWKKDEIVYAKKKLSEADKFGVTGANYDALLAAIENESLTYAQIAGKSSKLVQEIKAAKAAAADPFSEAALLKKYSKQEVESLFKAYDNFYATKVNHLHLSDKISKIEYEINWLKTNGKYSTSGVFREMLERDLALMKKELQLKLDNQVLFDAINEAKSKISNSILTGDKGVIKAANDLATTIGKKGITLEKVTAKAEKLNEAFAAYYKKQNAKLNNVKPDWSESNYTKARKDKALWSDDQYYVDGQLRPVSGTVWRVASLEEKTAAFRYTSGSSYINEPLRKQYYSGKYAGVYDGKVDSDLLTNLISRSSYDFDVWLQRGVDSNGIRGVFGDSIFQGATKDEIAKNMIGKTGIEAGFSSCGAMKGKGFSSSDIIYNIYAPKGTKMIYAEPFSAYSGGGGMHWDGIKKQTVIGHEQEMILQRSTKFRIIKAEYKDYKWYLDLEVIGQI